MLFWRHEGHGHSSGVVERMRVARVLACLGYLDAAEEALELVCKDYSMDWRPHGELATLRVRILDKTTCTSNAHDFETHVLSLALRGLVQACEAFSGQEAAVTARVRRVLSTACGSLASCPRACLQIPACFPDDDAHSPMCRTSPTMLC